MKQEIKYCRINNCINKAIKKGVCGVHYSLLCSHGSFSLRKYPITANFSNLVKVRGKWSSPEFYVCRYCGIILNIKNTYKNALKHRNYVCKKCAAERARNFHRMHKLSSNEGDYVLKKKIPNHPKDNQCMLCNKPPTRRTGLNFHHWIIIDSIAYGIWLCNICHMFAERYDSRFLKQYIELKNKILSRIPGTSLSKKRATKQLAKIIMEYIKKN